MMWIAAMQWINPKRLLYVAGGALVAFTVWQGANFVSAKYAAEAQVISLTAELSARDEAIRIMKKAAAQQASAQEAADAARDQIDTLGRTYEEIRRSAATVKEEDNGTLAPVLRDALRALDGM